MYGAVVRRLLMGSCPLSVVSDNAAGSCRRSPTWRRGARRAGQRLRRKL